MPRVAPFVNRQLSPSTSIGVVVAVYVLAWGGLLLSANAVFWDDWTLVDRDSASVLEMFRQNGLPWLGHFHVALAAVGPVGYHVLSLLLYLVSGLAVLGIVRRVESFSPNVQTFVACISSLSR